MVKVCSGQMATPTFRGPFFCIFVFQLQPCFFWKASIGQPGVGFLPNGSGCSKISPFWRARPQHVQLQQKQKRNFDYGYQHRFHIKLVFAYFIGPMDFQNYKINLIIFREQKLNSLIRSSAGTLNFVCPACRDTSSLFYHLVWLLLILI